MRTDSHGMAVTGLVGAKGTTIWCQWHQLEHQLMVCAIQYVDQIISAYEYVIEQRQLYNETQGLRAPS